jgi:hemoglobin/transferrin/lactoferrin receptor protein
MDMENIKRVIIQKNNSNFEQANSLGGGVEFTSKDPADYIKPHKNHATQFKAQYHSAAREKSYNGKTAFRGKQVSGYISLTSAKAQDLELNNDTTLANSAYEDFSFLTKMKFKNFRFSFENFIRKDNSPMDPRIDPETQYKDLLADSTLTKKTFNLSYISDEKFKAQVYLNDYLTEKYRRDDKKNRLRENQTIGLKIQKTYKKFAIGAQTYKDTQSSNFNDAVINAFPKAFGTTNSGFFEGYIHQGRSFIVPGIKFDSYHLTAKDEELNTKTASQISKKLDYHYAFSPNLKSKLSFSEGFNSPRVSEVFPTGLHRESNGFMIKDNLFIPNKKLSHEESEIKELELSYERSLFSAEDRFKLNISYYENNIQNYITLETIDVAVFDFTQPYGTTKFINIPKAKLYGQEIETSYLNGMHEVGLSYAQVRGRNLSQQIFLQDLPADFYTLSIKSTLDKYRVILGYNITRTLAQPRVNPQTTQFTRETPEYTTQDAFIQKNFNDFEVYLKVNNIGNKKYRKHASFLYESREDIRLAVKYKINSY